MRVFVAVEIPPRNLAPISAVVEGLRRHRARVAWVPAANVHVTLAFLGDIEMDRVAAVTAAVTAACSGIAPFELAIAGTGVFPSAARAKVLWAGVRGDLEELVVLRRRVVSELRAEGFQLDDKPFRPHLTIGRVKDARGTEFRAVLDGLERARLDGAAFEVSSVTVIRSELLPAGARYTPLARIRIGG